MSNGEIVGPPQAPTQTPTQFGEPIPAALDRHIRRGQDEYEHALQALLPQGIAWPRWPTSTLMKVVRGLAGIMGFADGRAADLLERESDPRATVEMLDSWERAWGLPDPCFHRIIEQPDGTIIDLPPTLGERRKILVMKMTLLGAQSREFFQSIATFLGYDISITEYRPFMVGVDRCGDNRAYDPVAGSLGPYPCQIGNPNMRFVWTVHILSPKLVWFRAASGQAGIDHHLEIQKAQDLECIIRRWAPAHTVVLFDYTKIGDPWAGTKKDDVQQRTGDLVTLRTGEQIINARKVTTFYLRNNPYTLNAPTFAYASLQAGQPSPQWLPFSVGSPDFAYPALSTHYQYVLGAPSFAYPTLTVH
jgi:uncharacterized protein YmfQ (DUF2313 family)